jgi:hypothetical protein
VTFPRFSYWAQLEPSFNESAGHRRPPGCGGPGIKAYEQAYEPKKLVLLPGGHFDAYVAEFDQACQPACELFAAHLLSKNLSQ